ncbi:MAG: FAD-dependent oxidoreductase [Zavarzinella sp.]
MFLKNWLPLWCVLLNPLFLLAADVTHYDIAIYGATPGGIAAARSAAKNGAKVLLIEPTAHIGGLTTSGLSHTDFRTFEGLSGAFLEFSEHVLKYYENKYGKDSMQAKTSRRGTHAEPHVNELVFEKLLTELPTITVLKNATLQSVETTSVGDEKVLKTMLIRREQKNLSIAATVFIDGTYEGDLMALAGIPYHVGREAKSQYGESLAPDKEDKQLQAYNFRMIMTRNPANRVEITQPANYNRDTYEDILTLLEIGKIKQIFDYPSRCVFKAQLPLLPNEKYDINDVSNGLVRLSMPGKNLKWPDGTAKERAAIFQTHLDYHLGLLWFLKQDPKVPEKYRSEVTQWGWCKDEFTDNNHLPWQLYVREARRMKGTYVFTEKDTDAEPGDVRAKFHPQSIACGDYGPNCHGTSHEGPLFGGKHTGEFYKRVSPYQIPYHCLLANKVNNLLVPVAVSSSHVGFCALRLEPIWMSLGQAAGVSAREKVRSGVSLHKLEFSHLQELLHAEKSATIYVSDVPPDHPLFRAVQWLGSKGGLHQLVAGNTKTYGQRGENIEGQYYKAYPLHDFRAEEKIDEKLLTRWLRYLPEMHRIAATAAIAEKKFTTRGEIVQELYKHRQMK